MPSNIAIIHADSSVPVGVEYHLQKIRALDQKLADAILGTGNALRSVLDEIEPSCADFPATKEICALDEHRSFFCKLLFARFLALHLSSKPTPKQMMWWMR